MQPPMEERPIFFYGTLRDMDLLQLVLGRSDLSNLDMVGSALPDHQIERVAGESFPMISTAANQRANGLLVGGLSKQDRARIAFFEDSDYQLRPTEVLAEGAWRPASVYLPTSKLRSSGEAWRFSEWSADDKELLMACATEQMGYFTTTPQETVEAWWPEIKARAEARLGRVSTTVKTARAQSDVDVRSRREQFSSPYCAVETVAVRIPLYKGGQSDDIERKVVRATEASILLPYDPKADCVMLIEQWRPGPWAAGAGNPWTIEAVAGIIDTNESPEEVARREAKEEAGLEIGRIEPIGGLFASPGLSDQKFNFFVGEAKLNGAGGVHGLAHEGEDIRAFRLDFFEAMAALTRGDIDNVPTAMLLLWLSRNRERLRLAWR